MCVLGLNISHPVEAEQTWCVSLLSCTAFLLLIFELHITVSSSSGNSREEYKGKLLRGPYLLALVALVAQPCVGLLKPSPWPTYFMLVGLFGWGSHWCFCFFVTIMGIEPRVGALCYRTTSPALIIFVLRLGLTSCWGWPRTWILLPQPPK